MSAFDQILESAKSYVEWDPNEETRAQVQALIDENNFDVLTSILGKRVQFGTAGLRAEMGPGYTRMNDIVVLQTTQGLAKYLEATVDNAKEKGIVIGYDHRRSGTLSSLGFARISAAVFLSQGFKVYMLENFVATPFVPFGIQHFGAAAGIMVTASHNPKRDNGFKVYWGNGAQIIPPHDANIAHHINENLAPWQSYDIEGVPTHELAKNATDEVADAYFAAIKKLCNFGEMNGHGDVKTAYTAMHGVGAQWIARSFKAFGHKALNYVPSQRLPDPEFPTVSFPNPEEKGALNEAMQFADEKRCTLIIANDPDADRLAVAEKNVETGEWKVFSGNEIGILLGAWQIQHYERAHPDGPTPAVLASVVSSRMLKAMAKKDGIIYHDTLTGFKWLGNRAIELKAQGIPVIFSFEEALGFCVGDVVCDKDGIAAGAVLQEMANATSPGGLRGVLQRLYAKYGEFVSYNSYVISHDTNVTNKIFHDLRTTGPTGGYWTEVAGSAIVSIQDITKGYDSTAADLKSTLPVTPDSHMLMYEFANGVSITLRTSGTEPKIKFYTEIAGQPEQTTAELKELLVAFVDQAVEEMIQPTKYGLKKA